MQSYAVGRPSIREAMQNLKRMGLIEINHGERPRVAAPSFERMVADMSETMRHVLMNSPATLDHLEGGAGLIRNDHRANRGAKAHPRGC